MNAILDRYLLGMQEMRSEFGRFWTGLLLFVSIVLLVGACMHDGVILVCAACSLVGLHFLAYLEGGADLDPIEFNAVYDAIAHERAEVVRVSQKAAVNEAAGSFISENDYVRRARALGAYREGNDL